MFFLLYRTNIGFTTPTADAVGVVLSAHIERTKFPVEGCEFSVQAVRLAGAFQDSEYQQTELAGKLRLVHHLTEQLSHRIAGKLICATSKRAQHQCILAVLHAHAEDGADLVAHNLGTGRGEAAVIGLVHQLHGTGKVIAAVETQGGYRDHVAPEGIVLDGKVFAQNGFDVNAGSFAVGQNAGIMTGVADMAQMISNAQANALFNKLVNTDNLASASSLASDNGSILIKAYETWGCDMAKHMHGMFAFALWDEETQTLFCLRDPFGTKPFYYYESEDGEFLFGTQIRKIMESKSFKKELNQELLQIYLTLTYTTGEDTFFKGVKIG